MKITNPLIITILPLLFLSVAGPKAQAVVPPPDGGYPGFTTAEGTNALKNRTTGVGNTAVGWFSLFSDTDGSFNTGLGAATLLFNVGDQSTGDGVDNTAVGTAALLFNVTGSDNTAIGTAALANNGADANTALGAFALNGNTSGIGNTAIGLDALLDNTTGSFSTATGFGALVHNNTNANTANGALALQNNTTGFANTAVGGQALQSNEAGAHNTATGYQALLLNTASDNTATGYQALLNNTTGEDNTAIGWMALTTNATGSDNTAIGRGALFSNVGNDNTAIGMNALGGNIGGHDNVAIGREALLSNTNGFHNIAIGRGAGLFLNGAFNIDIDDSGVAGENGTIRIGNNVNYTRTFIAGISGVPVTGTAVVVDANGQLGVAPSSKRFKDAIKPMDKASEAILALRPVTFAYKQEINSTCAPQFGLVAEEVAQVNPDLVVRDKKGEVYTVRYDAINAMLLNEFLKEHRKVEKLEATVADLAAQVQKISAHVRINNSAAQVIVSNH